MPTLSELQAGMAAYLVAPPNPDVPEPLRNLLWPGTTQPGKRFAIYKNNFYARLADALRDTFPAVERLVGEEFFRYAAVEFIAANPPKAPTLIGYGEHFPEFIENFAPAATLAYLADVARLELLYLESYHAADATPLETGAVTSGCDDTRPALHPSARLMTSPFQISRIWELNRSEAPFENISLPASRETLLIIRPVRQVEVRRVPFGAYAALQAFTHGASIAAARDEAERAEPGFPFDIHLAALAAGGTFT